MYFFKILNYKNYINENCVKRDDISSSERYCKIIFKIEVIDDTIKIMFNDMTM